MNATHHEKEKTARPDGTDKAANWRSGDRREDTTGAAKSNAEELPLLPYSVAAEKTVVSIAIQHPERLPELAHLTLEHFHTPGPRLLFEAIQHGASAGHKPEVQFIIQRLLDAGKLEAAGGASNVIDIVNHAVDGGLGLTKWLAVIEDKHARRQLWEMGEKLRESALHDTASPEEMLAAVDTITATAERVRHGHRAGNPFPITKAGDIEGTAEPSDFVQGLLCDGAASVVYGPSNCGKSFWVLDLCAAVATGRPFRGELAVEAGGVLYVALEGGHGLRNRLAAMTRCGLLPPGAPLFVCSSAVNLLDKNHAGRLVETVREAAAAAGMALRLVVIDTMARAMSGGDENSGQDMTKAVAAVDAVRAATGAHVLIVHHCGKDEAKGARGHSSLRAAVDTEIEVFRPEGSNVSTVRVTKQRDLPTGDPMPFSLDKVELGTDRRGEPITSCVVHHEDPFMAAERSHAGRKPGVSIPDLLELLPQPSTSDWEKAAKTELGVSKSVFHRNLKKIKAGNHAFKTVESGWESAKSA